MLRALMKSLYPNIQLYQIYQKLFSIKKEMPDKDYYVHTLYEV